MLFQALQQQKMQQMPQMQPNPDMGGQMPPSMPGQQPGSPLFAALQHNAPLQPGAMVAANDDPFKGLINQRGKEQQQQDAQAAAEIVRKQREAAQAGR